MVWQQVIDRKNEHAVMGLGEHLEELRRRVVHALLGLLPILAVSLYFGETLLAIVTQPGLDSLKSQGAPRHYLSTGPLETFSSYFKIAIITTTVLGGPWVIYQLWRFVAPGLYGHEKRFAYVLAPLSVLLTVGGTAFMYFVMLPIGLTFLVGFGMGVGGSQELALLPRPEGLVVPVAPALAGDLIDAKPGEFWFNTALQELRICTGLDDAGAPVVLGSEFHRYALIRQEYRLAAYMDFFYGVALAFILAFQTPVVVVLLGWVGIVSPALLGKYRRHAVVACVILAAVLTPTPDPLSLALLATPMYLLFELGVLLLVLLPAGKLAGGAGDADPEPTDSSGP